MLPLATVCDVGCSDITGAVPVPLAFTDKVAAALDTEPWPLDTLTMKVPPLDSWVFAIVYTEFVAPEMAVPLKNH